MSHEHFLNLLPPHIKRLDPRQFEENSLGLARGVQGAIQVQSADDVKEVLKLASGCNVSIHPISTGKNWGYGSALASEEAAILLDLSLLRQIRFDSRAELFTVGPGVTQQDLYNFLLKEQLEYLVPTTGAGPNVSVLANALERGFGVTPHEEHFSSVVSLKAVLPDGSDYIPIMTEKAGMNIWRWDIGPYLQGLFSQSGLGVVTELTLRLYPKPEVIGFITAKAMKLEPLLQIAKECRSIELVKGINLMNGERIAGMIGGEVRKEWVLVGSFYCRKELSRSLTSLVTKIFRQHKVRPFIANNFTFRVWGPILKKFDGKRYELLKGAFDALKGIPTTLALNLVGGEKNANKTGLIWYSPAIANSVEDVLKANKLIRTVCKKHGLNPLITFTLVHANASEITVPLIFSKDIQLQAAWDCYDELLNEGIKLGMMPYRYPINRFDVLEGTASNSLHKKIKEALDPKNVLDPGRYVTAT